MKPIATITKIADHYYVLKLGDREIGADSRARLERYARAQGYQIKKENS